MLLCAEFSSPSIVELVGRSKTSENIILNLIEAKLRKKNYMNERKLTVTTASSVNRISKNMENAICFLFAYDKVAPMGITISNEPWFNLLEKR